MSVYDEVSSSVKANNKAKNTKFIKNQKTMNILTMVLCLIMLIADTIYVIKESSIGILMFTRVVLDFAIVAEAFMVVILAIFKFNTENKIIKILTAVAFSISVIGYIAMFKYADAYSIILFIFRIPLSAIFIVIAVKSLVSLKSFILRWAVGGGVGAVVLITALILLFSANERRAIYDNGTLVNILDGTAKVKIEDGTTTIGASSLKNAGEKVEFPSSVKTVDKDAFLDSEVNTLTVSSSSISVVSALKNTDVDTIYIENDSVITIDDLKGTIENSDFEFIVSRDLVDAYRLKYSKYDYLFAPKLDDNEFYIAFNGTRLPVVIYTKDQLPKTVLNPYSSSQNVKTENNIKYILTSWDVNGDAISYPFTVTGSTEFNANWERIYIVTYDYDGGTPADGSAVLETEEFYSSRANKTLPELEKSGYDFTGWYLLDSNGNFTNTKIQFIDTDNLADMTIKARFVKNYVLKYHLNGGTMTDDETTVFNEDGSVIVPPTPTKEGYSFDGWYDNAEFSGSSIAVVASTSQNDIELYAKWVLDNPTITLSNDINKTFDNQYSELKVTPSHALSTIAYTYAWYKSGSSDVLGKTSSYKVRYVNESGAYYCVVTATDTATGETATVTSNNINVTINKANYELPTILNTYSYEYDGNAKTPNIGTIPTGLDGSVLNVSYSNTAIKNVGDDDYVTISFSTESDNYNIPSSTKVYVRVTPKTLTITWPESLEFTYNGSAQYPLPTITGLISGDECTFTYSDTINNINVGTYSIEVTGLSNENYQLPTNTSVVYTIVKATKTITGITVSDVEATYDGNAHYPAITGNLPSGIKALYSEEPVNVGTYNVTVTFTYESDNYEINDSYTRTVTIIQKEVTVASSSVLTYNGSLQAPTLTVSGLVDGDTCTATVSGNTNAGEYTENVTLSNNNYVLSSNTFTYTINKATYDLSGITFSDASVTYDGKAHGITIKGTLPMGKDGVQISVSYSNTTNNINVGSYEVVASFVGSTNYETISDMTANITINAKQVSVVFDDSNLTYNGNAQAPTATVSGLIDGDTCSVTITKNTVAGTYSTSDSTLTVELNNSNYILRSTDVYTYTINKADYDISGITYEGIETTYTGNAQIVTFDDLPTGADGYELSATYYIDDVANASRTDAGSYTIVVKFSSESPNYNDVSDIEKTFVINPKTLTVTWNAVAFEYDGTAKAPTATVSGYVNSDTATFEYSDTSNNINVGTYTISIINLSNSNYTLPANATTSYTIAKGVMTLDGVSVSDLETVYDGNVHYPKVNGILPDGVTAVYSVDPKDVGTYSVTVTFEYDSDDYAISESYTANVTITQKTVTVSSESVLTYNANEQAPTLTVSGLVDGDTCKAEVNGNTLAGTYTEDVTLSNTNYVLASSTFTYTINKATYSYSLTFTDETVTYDGSLHGIVVAGTLPTGLDGVQVSVSYSSTGITDVGSLLIKATFTVSSNYEAIDSMTATITVSAKTVTLTYSNENLTYNGSQQAPTATISGLIGTDTCTATIQANTDAGTYSTADSTLTVTLSNSNYKLADDYSYSYTIAKADYDISGITYLGLEATYTGSALSISISGLPTGLDNYKLSANYYIGGVENATVKNAGTYDVTVKFTSNSNNYNDVADAALTMVVSAKTITVTFNDDLVYTGEAQAPTLNTITGVVSGDTVNVTVTAKTNAGTYSTSAGDITVTLNNSNYQLGDDFEYSYTISPKAVSIVWGTTTFTYDGSEHVPTATLGDSALTLEVTANTESINAGTYTATATITDTNYDVESDKTIEFTIEKATFESNKTVTNVETTYDGETHDPSVSGSNQYVDEALVTWKFSSSESAVGTYTITVTFHATDNYEDVEVTATVTIKALELSLEFDSTEFTFNNEIQKPTVTSSNVLDGDIVTFTVKNTSVDAGTYTASITLSGTDAGNYALPSAGYTYTINKADYDMTSVIYSNTEVSYTGEGQSPVVSNLPTGVDNITVTYDAGTVTDVTAGTAVTITFATTSTNYNVPASVEVTMIVNPAELTISFDSSSFTYDGLAHTPTATLSGVIGSEDVDFTINANNINAGTYTLTDSDITLSGSDMENYTVAEFEYSYTISPKTVSIVWGTTTFTYDGSEHVPTATLGDSALTLEVTANTESINAGTYTATATITDTNYDVESDKTIEFTIEKATFSCDKTVTNVEVTYNGSEQYPSVTGASQYVDGTAITWTYSGAAATVGSHIVTVIFHATDNFEDVEVTATVTITELELLLEFDSTEFTFNDEIQKPTVTSSNVIDGDTVIFIVNNSSVSAGTYTASITLSGSDAGNYKLPTTGYTYTINKADYDMTSVIYSNTEVSYTGEGQSPVVSNLPTGVDNITVTYEAGIVTDVTAGTAVTITFATTSTNYNVPASVEVTMIVNPAELTISFDSSSFTYDGAAKTPTGTLSGVIDGDTVTFTINANNINAGTYTLTKSNITLSGSDMANYTVAEFDYEYTINQATMDLTGITVSDVETTYDGISHDPVPTGDLPIYDSETVSYTISGETIKAGTHTVSVVFSVSSGNYEDYTIEATVTINALAITVTYDSLEFTYNGNVQAPTITSNNLITGDDVTLSVSNTSKSAGTYTVSLTLEGDDVGNYNLPIASTTYTINKATYDLSSVTYSNTEVTYTGEAQSPVVAGLPTGLDKITVTYTAGTVTNVTSGTDVTITFATTSTNYNVPDSVTVTMVVKAATLTVSGDSFSVAYTGSEVAPTITLSGIYGTDDVSVTVNNKNLAVGSYTLTKADVTLTGADAGNYVLDDFSVSYEITKGEYDTTGIVFEDTSLVYNGEAQTITVSGSFTNTGADGTTPNMSNITYSGSGTNVGEYTITATIPSESDNYNDVVLTATLTITAATVDAIFYIDSTEITNSSTSVKYTGNSHTLVAEADSSDLYNGDTVTLEIVITYSGTAVSSIKKAGTYSITAYVTDNDNYEASDTAYTVTIEITDIWWLGWDKDHLSNSINLNNDVKITADEVLNGENEDFYFIYSVTSTGEVLDDYPTEAGSYTVTLHYDSDSVTVNAKTYNNFTLSESSGTTTVDFSSGWTLSGTDTSTAFSGTTYSANSLIATSNSTYSNLASVSLTYTVEDKGSTSINVYTSTDGETWTLEGTITPTRNDDSQTGTVNISTNNTGDVYVKIEITCTKGKNNAKTASISSATLACDVLKVS